MLQLALVKAVFTVPVIKRNLNMLNKLYTVFHGSSRRFLMLRETQLVLDDANHKRVQPGETRWLSYEGSAAVICCHYASTCVTLEAIYVEAGNISCDAGGILLTMRADSRLLYLHVLSTFLQPFAKLNRCFETSDIDIVSALQSAKAVISVLRDTDMQDFLESSQKVLASVRNWGVRMDHDPKLDRAKQVDVANKFKKAIIDNILTRFSDEICYLSELLFSYSAQRSQNYFINVKMLDVNELDMLNEWRFIEQLPIPPSPGNAAVPAIQTILVDLATSHDRRVMFPVFSSVAEKILLLSVGTAGVERSFYTMNRILSGTRCRLTPEHVKDLMLIIIEDPEIPDVRGRTV